MPGVQTTTHAKNVHCTVGNAKLDGLTTDLHMTGNQYLLTLTLYFLGYVSFETLFSGLCRWALEMKIHSNDRIHRA